MSDCYKFPFIMHLSMFLDATLDEYHCYNYVDDGINYYGAIDHATDGSSCLDWLSAEVKSISSMYVMKLSLVFKFQYFIMVYHHRKHYPSIDSLYEMKKNAC
mgnify:FL=1